MENHIVENLMIDHRVTTATMDVEKTIKRIMENATMDVVMTTTPDAVRTTTKETSRRRIANPEQVTQMGEGVEMTRINHRTTTRNGERGPQRKTKRRAEHPERNAQGAVTTEEEMTHRLTVKRRMMTSCPTDGEEDGGHHAVQNQVTLKRPARAIRKTECSVIKMPAIPKSSYDLGDFSSMSRTASCWHLADITSE
jgi:hypothetical protein